MLLWLTARFRPGGLCLCERTFYPFPSVVGTTFIAQSSVARANGFIAVVQIYRVLSGDC
jgi:hypothetical protein